MRIAYVTIADPADRYAWSGINHAVARRLTAAGAEILPVGPLHSTRALLGKARAWISRKSPWSSGRYLWTLNPALLRSYAEQVERQLDRLQPDVVMSPGTQPLTNLAPEWPTVFWTDAAFGAMHNYYGWYRTLSPGSVRDGYACDDRALRQCRAACYSSAWAAEAAVAKHKADPTKVHVVPFGANLDHDNSPEEVAIAALARLRPPWRFLFVGVEWDRKGGDLAMEVVRLLNERGYPSELIVAGCQPPARCHPLPEFVRVEGFISQHTEAGRDQLASLFESALFYLMPSKAEAYGIVFCEASAHGVPSLSTKTGGIPTILHDGENGQLFALDAGAEQYVDFILQNAEPQRYAAFAQSSLAAYRERLAWEVNIPRVFALLGQAAGHTTAAREVSPLSA